MVSRAAERAPVANTRELTKEHRICRIKSLRRALQNISQMTEGTEVSRKEDFLPYPHTMTNGVGWQTDVLHKLCNEGLLKKAPNGLWYVKSEGAHRFMTRDGIARLLEFGYVDECSTPAEVTDVPKEGPPSTSWARVANPEVPTNLTAEEAAAPVFLAPDDLPNEFTDRPQVDEILDQNISYIREGIDLILEELSKPKPPVSAATIPAAQVGVALSGDRLLAIEQGIQSLQKDIGTLSRAVKVAISQWIGEDK